MTRKEKITNLKEAMSKIDEEINDTEYRMDELKEQKNRVIESIAQELVNGKTHEIISFDLDTLHMLVRRKYPKDGVIGKVIEQNDMSDF